MKIAAVVILYHPTVKTLENIKTYASVLDQVYAFDNTEEGSVIKNSLMEIPNISYFNDKHNAGIAKRLNTAAQIAINDGFDWLLMMDQDSSFNYSTFNLYRDNISNYPDKNQVAIFGPNFSREQQNSFETIIPEEVSALITSGSILNLSAYQQIGMFDEALFIDGVDTEYCLRAQNSGFKIVQLFNIFLKHELGESVRRASIKTLYLVKKTKAIHSPIRCYYIYRNNLYLQDKYKYFDKTVMKYIHKGAIADIKRSILYGREFRNIAKYIVEARRDFKQKKMGKYHPLAN
ncbi:glycosyltransferase family 2 protein [Arcicella rosea]|uniref:Rhamnosyltransferase n=1 Tax=Arcicella rosea TaxID=502909 RepID=A0A841EQR8_9BACT|nr:glycosyltransferase family 2 protein [Arcicella rosea]MBB6005615.1 rhamnosyltransferase [Arcicella rosea]